MRAAVLLLTGCSLPAADSQPVDHHHGTSIGETSPPSGPALQVRPATVDFGVVQLNYSVTKSIELSNVGLDDLVLGEFRLENNDPTIGIDWSGSETLAAGASGDVFLSWSPERVQSLGNQLRIVSNDPVAPLVTVWLTGATDGPQIELNPSVTDFGEMPIGLDIAQSIHVSNVGNADLEIESLVFLTTDPNDLDMKPIETPLLVPAGMMVGVTIQWAPTDEGKDIGILTVQSNDPVTPEVRAELYGIGVTAADTGA